MWRLAKCTDAHFPIDEHGRGRIRQRETYDREMERKGQRPDGRRKDTHTKTTHVFCAQILRGWSM